MSRLFAISASDSFVIECIDKNEAEEFVKECGNDTFTVREITVNTEEPLEALNDKISHIGAESFMSTYCR